MSNSKEDIVNATVASGIKASLEAGFTKEQALAMQTMITAGCNYYQDTMMAIVDAAFSVTMGTLLTKGVIDDADLEEIKSEFEKLLPRAGQ